MPGKCPKCKEGIIRWGPTGGLLGISRGMVCELCGYVEPTASSQPDPSNFRNSTSSAYTSGYTQSHSYNPSSSGVGRPYRKSERLKRAEKINQNLKKNAALHEKMQLEKNPKKRQKMSKEITKLQKENKKELRRLKSNYSTSGEILGWIVAIFLIIILFFS